MDAQNLMSLKGLPVGKSEFNKIVENDFYYVDKTSYIKTVIKDDTSEALLITRPRRFGKSLTMDTIYQFLRLNPDDAADISYQEKLFAGTTILEEQEFCRDYMGQYPVIFISLKDIEAETFTTARDLFASTISEVACQFDYLLDSPKLSKLDKKNFEILRDANLLFEPKHIKELTFSLKCLTELLAKHHGKKVIVLIDEYDVPLANAYNKGFYDKMISLLRPFLSRVLKGNTRLQKAVLTGCLRISKESIFTGLNNPKVNSVTNDAGALAQCMGFSKTEVKDMLSYYGLSEHEQAVKDWYDGYRIADREIFCPWDVINFCDQAITEKRNGRKVSAPRSYWSSTSSNDIIQQFMSHLDKEEADRMQILLDGGEIEFSLNDQLNYSRIDKFHSADDFWTLLLYTGYLTAVKTVAEGNLIICTVRIPNREIRSAFENNIKAYYGSVSMLESTRRILQAFFKGDADQVNVLLGLRLKKFVSIRDFNTRSPAENFYHGFLNGMFSTEKNQFFRYQSNAEAGKGYADIIFSSGDNSTGVVLELKVASDEDDMNKLADVALKQIEDRQYTDTFGRGIKKIYCYGIAFCRKECTVQCAEAKI